MGKNIRVCKKFVALGCFYFAMIGSVAFSQTETNSKHETASIGTNGGELAGDYFSTKDIRSPFRYVIVADDVQFDDAEDEKNQKASGRSVEVLMEDRAFNEKNLRYLFNYLSNYFSYPPYLVVEVHTSLMTLETTEERAAESTHSSRDQFRKYHKTATYLRFNDIDENCSEGFSYDFGKSGKFVRKHVKLVCKRKA